MNSKRRQKKEVKINENYTFNTRILKRSSSQNAKIRLLPLPKKSSTTIALLSSFYIERHLIFAKMLATPFCIGVVPLSTLTNIRTLHPFVLYVCFFYIHYYIHTNMYFYGLPIYYIHTDIAYLSIFEKPTTTITIFTFHDCMLLLVV